MKKVLYSLDVSNCPKCNKKALDMIDKFDRVTHNTIYPISKFRCHDCEEEFYVRWVKVTEKEFAPVVVDVAEVKNFEKDVVSYAINNRRILHPM